MKISLILGVLFVLSIQPMMMISMLIMIILMYSLIMMWNFSSFWYSYMLILILMSGILVVFTYMMSVLPNEGFKVSSLTAVIFTFLLFYKDLEGWEYSLSDIGSMKIWISYSMSISLILVIYLLMMMVMIVWASILEKGAIRIS